MKEEIKVKEKYNWPVTILLRSEERRVGKEC